ncbi:GAF domain-containing protein [Chondrinema litorale]|uniref:GAF domain-containing protein n=1 Tax=Chondrinema litorale TaxID=2994555 RepID=UPI002542B94B|nr:GAF domain-containing protein [Chondrinema litorale]UZR97565.1 GAF domain-containing protein [Chondrinema litorale]
MQQTSNNSINNISNRKVFREIWKKADKITAYTLIGYFIFGLCIAPIYNTWTIGLGVGTLCLISYFTTLKLLPKSQLHQYIASAVYAIFMAQFIYQMHGLFEMHFWVFIGCTLLIVYQNWKLQLPLVAIVVLHHGAFAYLQYTGMDDIYFTQLQYMDLQTFLFHTLLATVIFIICGYWSYDLRNKTLDMSSKQNQLERQLKIANYNKKFAEKISVGEFNTNYKLADEEDELGKALLIMRDNLVTAAEVEKNDKFMREGIAQLSEILQHQFHDMEDLSDEIISFVTKYLGLNQAGLFALKDDYLEMKACYAYNRKKFLDKKVMLGEGLLGQAYYEKDMIFMTEVPADYVDITSGLGHATPRCIVIMPLIFNEQVVGVIESASFNVLDDIQLNFFRKAAETIALSLISMRNAQETKTMLLRTQKQADQMRAQEEELRQNMEELQATQEEIQRQSEMNEYFMDLINRTGGMIAEFAGDGKVQMFNEAFAEALGIRTNQYKAFPDISGKIILWSKEEKGDYFNKSLTLQNNKGNSFQLEADFRKIYDFKGNLTKIIMIGKEVKQESAVLV